MTFWKPFLTGAVVSAASVLLLQRLSRPRKQFPKQTTRSALPNNDPEPVLLDSVELDMRMIRKAEGAIQKRTSRLVIVVERCTNDHNYSAILRTAEALGIQNIYIVCPPTIRDEDVSLTTMKGTIVKQGHQEMETRKLHHLYAQRATEWLTVREFATTAECLQELRETGHTIWATDLSQDAVCLTPSELPPQEDPSSILPPKLAIVFGTEAVGCTQEMLDGADLRVYLPLRGFADSLNLSVATALVVHHLFLLDPSIEGAMEEKDRRDLRMLWYPRLAQKRLLSARQKKERTRLIANIEAGEEMLRKQKGGQFMHPEQLKKMDDLPSLRDELQTLNDKIEQQGHDAVAGLIDNPPDPITDMRRADEHRTCFVGKNTKSKYGDVWDNMPATTGYQTSKGQSASFFRSRLAGTARASDE